MGWPGRHDVTQRGVLTAWGSPWPELGRCSRKINRNHCLLSKHPASDTTKHSTRPAEVLWARQQGVGQVK